jgi:hypothetical protein
MAEKKFTELVSPGMVTLYHKSGTKIQVYPVDANEILSQVDSEYSIEPFDNSGEDADAEEEVDDSLAEEEDGENLEDLSKAKLLNMAKAQGLNVKSSMSKAALLEVLGGGAK